MRVGTARRYIGAGGLTGACADCRFGQSENAVKWGCTPIQDKEDNACEYENH
ncbi:hypothetical protein [Ruminococcus sp.]|uniref:hypothetical protein n=1 Tax=Ruminococcus sp. TaxID=41978 RepID=UPI001AFFC0B2|nr:hypothetical protein [Ruminococcus sp.]MBO5557891.1 hypothetical protein [Ruminococcus sp.]